MAYLLKFQLRDTKREFPTEAARDNAYDIVHNQMVAWGIPEENIVLTKINKEICGLGHEHETIIAIGRSLNK